MKKEPRFGDLYPRIKLVDLKSFIFLSLTKSNRAPSKLKYKQCILTQQPTTISPSFWFFLTLLDLMWFNKYFYYVLLLFLICLSNILVANLTFCSYLFFSLLPVNFILFDVMNLCHYGINVVK